MKEKNQDVKIIDHIIRNRRAVFPPMYLEKEISKEILLEILENARWAPTHRKTQPWRFIIFQEERARKELSDYLANYYITQTPKEKFSEIKYTKTLRKPMQSAVVLAIIMSRDPEESVPEWEEIASVAMAVQNIWLSASARGIGGYWSSPKSIITADEFLGLEKHERCLGLFYMGYHIVHKLTSERNPLDSFVKWRV